MEEKNDIKKRKAGRTLLLNNEFSDMATNFEGVQNVHETSNGSKFIVFDTVENASKVYESLVENNVKVKYSYYKIFFRLSDCDLGDVVYDEMKNKIIDNLKNKIGDLNILYFKFYTKNNTLIGSGDFTVDTKETLDALVTLREIELEGIKIKFYRFKIRKNHNKAFSS